MRLMPKFCARLCLLGWVLFGLSAGQVEAAIEYWVVDLAGTNSEATGINERSQVVGWAKDANNRNQAFLWERGTKTWLGFLTNRWSNSIAKAINNRGEIAGYSSVSATNVHAFHYAGGVMTDIGTLGGPNSWGRAINEHGEIAGASDCVTSWPAPTDPQSFLWRSNQLIHVRTYPFVNTNDYPTPRYSCEAFGVDEEGRICGGTFLWATAERFWGYVFEDANTNFIHETNEMQVVGSLGVSLSPSAHSGFFGMNDVGQAVGWSYLGSNGAPYHAILVSSIGGRWRSSTYSNEWETTNTFMLDLGALNGTNGNSYATAINNRGWVVGCAATASGTNHAFLWREGVMEDLNDLIPPGSGWLLIGATNINDHGEIVGTGRYQGQTRGFLLQNNGRITHIDPAVQTNIWIFTNELEEIVTQTTVSVTGQVVQWAGIWDGNPYTTHVFTVEYCDRLRPATNWVPVAPTSQWPILENYWTDPDYPAVSSRFFRIRAELPP